MGISEKLKGLWGNVTQAVSDDEYIDDVIYGDEGGAALNNSYEPDDYKSPASSSEKVIRMATSNDADARTHKVIRVKGTDFNAKRKEAANFFKQGHVVYLNMDEANKDSTSLVLNFLGGMAYALDGELKRLSTSVYAIIPAGDEIGGDIYGDESKADYRLDETNNLFV